jgi:tripartite-type tricarboxylate transporter receptor subunit TctC
MMRSSQSQSRANSHNIFALAAALLAVAMLLIAPSPGQAAGYPDKPIHIIVPFGPGGGGDIIVRLVGQELSKRLGQPVVVENRTGASGNIGTEFVAHASPDGYTLLMANVAPMAINAAVFKHLPYNPVKDFTAISPLAVFANVLVVPPSLHVHNINELVALSKKRPGGLNYASAGMGSITNLSAVMFHLATGAMMVQVPYRGGGPAIAGLLGAEVDMYFSSLPAALPHVKSGQLVALGVTSEKRSASAPEIPTLAEEGLSDFNAVTWIGLVGPAGLPEDVVARLNSALAEILRSTAVREQMIRVGAEASYSSAAAFASYIRKENKRWAEIVRQGNIPTQ